MKLETLIALAIGLAGLIAVVAITWKLRRADKRRPHIEVIFGDITEQHVDAIVNAAKPSLLGGGGVDGAIHKAGGPAILRECRALRAMEHPHGLTAGDAVATSAGMMDARWVIHTVGPVYDKHAEGDQAAILRSCYIRSLEVADQLGAKTVAFPLISAGVYGWPIGDAVRQALATIATTKTNVQTVRLVLFDDHAYVTALSAAAMLGAH